MPLHQLPSDHQHHHHHPLRPLTPQKKKKKKKNTATHGKKLDPPLLKPEGSGFAARKLEGS